MIAGCYPDQIYNSKIDCHQNKLSLRHPWFKVSAFRPDNWCLCHVYLMSIWCLFDVCLISVWCLVDVYLMCTWCLFDVYLMSISCLFYILLMLLILHNVLKNLIRWNGLFCKYDFYFTFVARKGETSKKMSKDVKKMPKRCQFVQHLSGRVTLTFTQFKSNWIDRKYFLPRTQILAICLTLII